MSDKLKKFIRQSKSKFDIEPAPDLFDKIMENMGQPVIYEKPHSSFVIHFKWIAVAASITILVISSLLFFRTNTDHKITSTTETSSLHNSNTSITSEIQNIETPNPSNKTSGNESDLTLNTPQSSPYSYKTERQYDKLDQQFKITKSELSHSVEETTIEKDESQPVVMNPVVQSQEANETQNVNGVFQETQVNAPKQTIAESQSNLSTSATDIIASTPAVSANPEKIVESVENTQPESVATDNKEEAEEDEPEQQGNSLKSNIRKGFFKFLSKKAKKWSGNTLSIENKETGDESVLAVHFKSERFEYSRDIKLGEIDSEK